MGEPTFDMKSVSSSNISAVGYDEASKTLRIEFVKGATYYYKNVPKSVYRDLLSADSVGQYFAAHIKHDFEYHKV